MSSALSRRAIRAAFCALALAGAGCVSKHAPPASPGDCATVRVWSNGWHTNIALPAEPMSPEHPLRILFPDARYFLIGWGERDFYLAEDPGFWTGLDAVVPPSPSVMQVIAGETPVEDAVWPGEEVVSVALSGAGRERLAREIAETMVLGEGGRPVVLQGGRVQGASAFLKARPGFHLFHMCNHWTAARLASAGVELRPRLAFHAPWLMDALKRKTPRSCPR